MADIFQAVDRPGVRAFIRLLGWTAILAIAVLSLVPGELRPHGRGSPGVLRRHGRIRALIIGH
jgi:hypothetical protein